MCESMSATRYLLIVLAIVSSFTLCAENYLQTNWESQSIIPKNNAAQFTNELQLDLLMQSNNSSINLHNQIYLSDAKDLLDKNCSVIDNARITAYKKINEIIYSGGANIFVNSPTKMNMGNVIPVNEKHNVFIAGELSKQNYVGKLAVNWVHQNYKYNPMLPDVDSEDEFHYNAKLSADLGYGFSADAAYKYNDNNQNHLSYDYYTMQTGLNYKAKLGYSVDMSVGSSYQNTFGNNNYGYNQEWRNEFCQTARISYRPMPAFQGSLSIINRTLYDEGVGEWYLLSNLIRLQGKYTLDNDMSFRSYVLGGIKVSEENKTSCYFMESQYPLVENTYIHTESSFSPQNPDLDMPGTYGSVGLGLVYYLNTLSSIEIKDLYNSYEQGDYEHTISMNLEMIF